MDLRLRKIFEIYNSGDKSQKGKLELALNEFLGFIKEKNKFSNLYTHINENLVQEVLNRFDNNLPLNFYSLKDAFFVKDLICSAASNILSQYSPGIDCDVYKFMSKDFVLVGITNCDEFCCGSYSEYSYYGPVVVDDQLPVGGSSGGASAEQYYGFSNISIGTDTGGSCRFPAILINKYSFKPTYGLISRYGLISYSQSQDVVGFIFENIQYMSKIIKTLFRYSPQDSCMSVYFDEVDIQKIKVVVVDYENMLEPQKEFIERLEKNNIYEVVYTDIKINLKLICIVYEIISSIELFSSLNRFDRIKYRDLNQLSSLDEIYQDRFKFLGSYVRGKVMQGALFLHNKTLRESYYKALSQRSQILYTFHHIIKKYEDHSFKTVVLTPDLCRKKEEVRNMEGYLILSNISGCPSVTIPLKSYNSKKTRSNYVSILAHAGMKNDKILEKFIKETEKYA